MSSYLKCLSFLSKASADSPTLVGTQKKSDSCEVGFGIFICLVQLPLVPLQYTKYKRDANQIKVNKVVFTLLTFRIYILRE